MSSDVLLILWLADLMVSNLDSSLPCNIALLGLGHGHL